MVKRSGGALLLSLHIDRESGRLVTTQVFTAIREMILSGGLNAGERLPASRTLAKDLGISRTTVIEVFERLAAEGLIESRTGAGTFVSDALRENRPAAASPPTDAAQQPLSKPRLSRTIARASEMFNERLPHKPRAFTTAMPAFDAFPLALWSRQMSKHWRDQRNIVMGYSDPHGYGPLRRAVASHLRANRGIACEPEQIFIVGGAQQAFYLIGSLLLDLNDKVWFENPGAIGARNSLVACGANLIPMPVDDHGLMVEEGLRLAPDFRLAFVTPAHQQPLGSTMSLERRFALLKAADKAEALIIEDDYDGEFCYGGHPQPTLKSVDATGRVIYVGTFSKTLFPALRLGYFVSPPALVDVFNQVSNAFLQGVPSANQAVVASFMEEGHFAAHIRRMRKIYAERHQVLCDAAREHLSGLLEIVPTDTGLHTIGLLPDDLRENEAAAAAGQKGITVTPIERFSIAPTQRNGLVLGFSGIKPPDIVAGVTTLASALEGVHPNAGTGRVV
ncbi:PLP-dependent aminotransferase family protein [Denitrobaculum tricleocarpae]|uniref:PLP-dependent aminotransferase family protein n=1 Tax=Denitrobaculum tricleocarpae TaxID=2591009 RepID=A0A545TES1_9PROT|nr:PLP-dependent aminotransferase family protein [Denitrobaculum tricleocarpae]TQV75714.1 PLP-dependent aminotransferase family protein [Denitrobaculum tricleocarpae]